MIKLPIILAFIFSSFNLPCDNTVKFKIEVIYESYPDHLKRICNIPDLVKWSYKIKVKYAPNIKAKLKTYKKRKKNVF